MWPPIPASFLFWPWTIAIAFQRISASILPLQMAVAGIGHFIVLGNGVEIRGGYLAGRGDSGLARSLAQGLEQLARRAANLPHDVVKRLNPLGYLCGKINLGRSFKFHRHKQSLYPHSREGRQAAQATCRL